MSNDVIKAHLHSALALLDGADVVKNHLTSAFAAESARADAAEQRVCELRDVLFRRDRHDVAGSPCDTPTASCTCAFDVVAALASTADIAGRWVSRADYDAIVQQHAVRVVDSDAFMAMAVHGSKMESERDAAIARAEDAFRTVRELQRCVGEATKARDELGIQYAAAQAEIARMREALDVVRLARRELDTEGMTAAPWREALDALDTVPGDALAKEGV